jgi:Mg2+-importing ATPase
VIVGTLVLPFTVLGQLFGFGPLSLTAALLIGIIILAYILAAEVAKRVFYQRVRL